MLLLRSLLIRLLHWTLARGLFCLTVEGHARLQRSGPAIIVANHNSHLDILILASLFRWRDLRRLRPVAAADYFCRNRLWELLAVNFLRVVPMYRYLTSRPEINPLQECVAALDQNEILLFFPEGTRGKPGKLSELKPGIAYLSRRRPDVPVFPVLLDGLDAILPKGRIIPKPGSCSAHVIDPLYWCGAKQVFMQRLRRRLLNVPPSVPATIELPGNEVNILREMAR